MDVRTALQGDHATVEVDISIHCALDNNIAIKGHHIAIHRAINGDRTAKRDDITAEHLIAGNHKIATDERPVSDALITSSWELGTQSGRGEGLLGEKRSGRKEQ
uniref:Uncharacterized protein n=1 Tax=Thermogemmatispora argillosa TaxID=2045280 RepID=A0A455T5I0_9CHLR|nr:hypothetical protein KTA_28410 [Thermogemmatispora argillosa]